MAGQPLHPVRINGHCFERRAREILALLGQLRHDVVRQILRAPLGN